MSDPKRTAVRDAGARPRRDVQHHAAGGAGQGAGHLSRRAVGARRHVDRAAASRRRSTSSSSPRAAARTIVAGSANQAEKWAELRTFEHLKLLHAQRFKGAEIPLNRVQYNELLDKLQGVLRRAGAVRGAHGRGRRARRRRRRRRRRRVGRVGHARHRASSLVAALAAAARRDVVPHAPAAIARHRRRRRRAVAVPARLLLSEGSLRAGAARPRRAGVRQGRAGDAAGLRGVVRAGARRRRRVAGARRPAGARCSRPSCSPPRAKSCPSGSRFLASSTAGASSTSRSTASSTAWRWRSASPPSRTSCASRATASASASCARSSPCRRTRSSAPPWASTSGAPSSAAARRQCIGVGAPLALRWQSARLPRRLRLRAVRRCAAAGCTRAVGAWLAGAVGVRPATRAPRPGGVARSSVINGPAWYDR